MFSASSLIRGEYALESSSSTGSVAIPGCKEGRALFGRLGDLLGCGLHPLKFSLDSQADSLAVALTVGNPADVGRVNF